MHTDNRRSGSPNEKRKKKEENKKQKLLTHVVNPRGQGIIQLLNLPLQLLLVFPWHPQPRLQERRKIKNKESFVSA